MYAIVYRKHVGEFWSEWTVAVVTGDGESGVSKPVSNKPVVLSVLLTLPM